MLEVQIQWCLCVSARLSYLALRSILYHIHSIHERFSYVKMFSDYQMVGAKRMGTKIEGRHPAGHYIGSGLGHRLSMVSKRFRSPDVQHYSGTQVRARPGKTFRSPAVGLGLFLFDLSNTHWSLSTQIQVGVELFSEFQMKVDRRVTQRLL